MTLRQGIPTLRHFGRPVRETENVHRVSDRAERRARVRGERWR